MAMRTCERASSARVFIARAVHSTHTFRVNLIYIHASSIRLISCAPWRDVPRGEGARMQCKLQLRPATTGSSAAHSSATHSSAAHSSATHSSAAHSSATHSSATTGSSHSASAPSTPFLRRECECEGVCVCASVRVCVCVCCMCVCMYVWCVSLTVL